MFGRLWARYREFVMYCLFGLYAALSVAAFARKTGGVGG